MAHHSTAHARLSLQPCKQPFDSRSKPSCCGKAVTALAWAPRQTNARASAKRPRRHMTVWKHNLGLARHARLQQEWRCSSCCSDIALEIRVQGGGLGVWGPVRTPMTNLLLQQRSLRHEADISSL